MKEVKSGWKKNITIPNALSVLRLLVIYPCVVFFLREEYVWAALMLVISGLSDMFDGMIARHFDQYTPLGAMLDPVADKLTLAAVVVCLGIKFPVILPLVVLLVVKELAMLVAGCVLLKKHKRPPAARWYGKVGTIVFYFSVIVIVGLKAIWNIENNAVTITLLSLTAVCMLFALVNYFLVFLGILKEDEVPNKEK
ncbi:MAG TPA: CDP-alcohol phosphatidyltransferase family protein [Candidatus Gallacutalibacter stercoravium]|nr:CDP-alcohol phosphatidyltransferase family protein [Candidatus Gallacutalibacter stercoravium]